MGRKKGIFYYIIINLIFFCPMITTPYTTPSSSLFFWWIFILCHHHVLSIFQLEQCILFGPPGNRRMLVFPFFNLKFWFFSQPTTRCGVSCGVVVVCRSRGVYRRLETLYYPGGFHSFFVSWCQMSTEWTWILFPPEVSIRYIRVCRTQKNANLFLRGEQKLKINKTIL